MPKITVFDVETPNRLNHRMSAIGVTVIEDGAITQSFYSLVDPETDFDAFNTVLTGIDEDAVRGAPTFPQLWPRLEPLFSGALLAAHNAPFDLGVLKRCLQHYEIDWQRRADYVCTVQMGRRLLPGMSHRLDALCALYGLELDHHHAGSDSRACAEILLRYLRGGAELGPFVRSYSFW